MSDPITKLVDSEAVAKDVRNVYALLTKIEKRLDGLEARIKALEPVP